MPKDYKRVKKKVKDAVSVEALKKRLTNATASIKTLEGKRDAAMEMLKRMPTVREGIYAATFAGLTYAYYKGTLHLLPKFFFQFGEVVDDPLGSLVTSESLLFALGGPLGQALVLLGLTPDIPGLPEKKEKVPDMDDYYKAQIKRVNDLIKVSEDELKVQPDDEHRKPVYEVMSRLNEMNAKLYGQWAKFTGEAILIAMGLAGGTMLFLMETSTSEVANIGAKMLDAVTPLT